MKIISSFYLSINFSFKMSSKPLYEAFITYTIGTVMKLGSNNY